MSIDLALYTHWTFCLAKCPYCDFGSHVCDQIDQPGRVGAVRHELFTEAARLDHHRLTS
jgi:coproporphyrinogen III oxidase-like Fe-S oxidoreductase